MSGSADGSTRSHTSSNSRSDLTSSVEMRGDLIVGSRLPVLERTIGLIDAVAYAGATWDWLRLHYDHVAANEAGFAAPVVDGQMLGAILASQATRWAGPSSWLRKLSFRLSASVLVGETIRCEGEVRSVSLLDQRLEVTLAQDIRVGERVVIQGATAVIEVPQNGQERMPLHPEGKSERQPRVQARSASPNE